MTVTADSGFHPRVEDRSASDALTRPRPEALFLCDSLETAVAPGAARADPRHVRRGLPDDRTSELPADD